MTYHELPITQPQRGDGGGFLLGLIAGAAVGGGLALLFAPRQGADMRHGLAASAQEAGRRLTEAYGSVASTARRNARRFVGHAGGRTDDWGDTPFGTTGQARDRAADSSQVLRDAARANTYESAAVEPSEAGPGPTAPASPESRSPLV